MGAICGRYANRIANAQFKIQDKKYNLSKNESLNHIHGGNVGFNKVIMHPVFPNMNGTVQKFYIEDTKQNVYEAFADAIQDQKG